MIINTFGFAIILAWLLIKSDIKAGFSLVQATIAIMITNTNKARQAGSQGSVQYQRSKKTQEPACPNTLKIQPIKPYNIHYQ